MRSRNENSRYRQKRGEALAGNFEKKYGSNFGVRSELTTDNLKKQQDDQSLIPAHNHEERLKP
ncbi:hypothetical protein [Paenibacillus pseudetheri]|uniref:Uncharacterized protein n=1 Tax=Paenibacillus pseudetheri TaxID=2897682 RepID=A0ABN8FKR9_9BACL|nr:hypothetical protein [Paenibacillus pseudetheri]CAH1056081.1 hypothetical protein PAECIP111894_02234 [Paenibacillus pseudetheri]